MDTSEQYINMCKAAKELQEQWMPQEGDFFEWLGGAGYIGTVETIGRFSEYLRESEGFNEFSEKRKDCVWLPRLDQLIELSGKHWSKFLFNVVEYQAVGINESAEIAALYEIMENKYEKEWNGEDWLQCQE